MKFTYYGHSCFGVQVKGKHLLFDPFISANEQAASINVEAVPADYILLSHGHADHVLDAVRIAKRTGALVIAAFEIHSWLNTQGISNTHPMNTGGKKAFDFGTVRCVVAQHSSTLPDGSPGGNPLGFLITTDEGDFYYSGDTALTLDMQLIPSWGKPHFSILPVGDNFTMGYEDAAVAAGWVGSKKIIGVHYDTFGYIRIDHEQAQAHFRSLGMELLLPAIGSVTEL
jgi:L-ascorbate metabolism protein UlaG (beta-lactamase superfamily)